MEVSIQRSKPGARNGVGLPSFTVIFSLIIWTIAGSLPAGSAHGFSIRGAGGGGTERLRAGDVLQGGGSLSGATEQTFDQGTFQGDLNDFNQPLELGAGGPFLGSLTASIVDDRTFEIRLTREERRDCLSEADFDVQLQVVSPSPDTLESRDASGGQLRVLHFEAQSRGGRGGRCSNRLRFGYALDLALDGAVAAGRYEGTAEITVRQLGPGGATEALQIPLRVDMPDLLLLYHYSQISVDLEASALASALGANSACSGGFCLDVGSRAIPVVGSGGPVAVGIGALTPAFNPVQTITLRNAVGVRAIGCSGNRFDSANYQILSAVGGIQPTSGIITEIENQPCGLNMRTGDLSFDLDLTQVDGATARASATIQITVTGL